MPELTAILLAEQYRADLLKAEAASAVRLVNAYGAIYKRLLLQMDALTADLDLIAAKGEAPTRWQLQRLDRFRALKAQVLDEMQRYSAGVEIEIDQGARSAIAAAGKNGHDLVEASLPGVAEIDARIMASWQTLDTDAVETMVGFLDPRSPLKQGLRTMYGPTVADAVERGLLESIALGYNPRKLAATFTRDLGMGLVSSLRLSRTVQLNAYREATRAGYAANPEIVKGWKRRATRDSRTCMACLSLDGTVHPVTESLQDHWNGRCVALPMSIDYTDLGLDVPPRQPTDQWLASLPQDQQRAYLGPKRYDAWKSGDLRFSETGRQWFERQSEAAQRAQMGPGKWEAWRAGKFGFEELSIRVPDRIWGTVRVETPLKTLLAEKAAPPAGSAKAGGFVPATDADLKRLKIPKGYHDVRINADPGADMVAVMKDSKGRTQYRYSAAHSEAATVAKFARAKDFAAEFTSLSERIRRDAEASEAAAALNLIRLTGFRVGSAAETGAKVKAYGVTTLLPEHVIIRGDEVVFSFVGKKGVSISKTIRDADLAADMARRKARGGELFGASDAQVRNYLHKIDGGFKVKDFRTWHGTAVALREIAAMPVPATAREFARSRLAVGKAVANHLGNTPTVALGAYIDPHVFQAWRLAVGEE